jgi:hypothetical protein
MAVFLGAGASCSEGASAQSQLFKDFFSESFENYRGISSRDPALGSVRVMKN